jgi:hypothetical protein
MFTIIVPSNTTCKTQVHIERKAVRYFILNTHTPHFTTAYLDLTFTKYNMSCVCDHIAEG